MKDAIEKRFSLVSNHAKTMVDKLTADRNLVKGDWASESSYEHLLQAKAEIEELHAALWKFEHYGGSLENVESEAADVSNRVAMLVDCCRRNTNGK